MIGGDRAVQFCIGIVRSRNARWRKGRCSSTQKLQVALLFKKLVESEN